jgi:hypothetical protein
MASRSNIFIALLTLGAAAAAQPKPSVESVTVTGTKSRAAIAGFVQSLAKPTHLTGKLTRWETPICPLAVGLKPEHLKFVTDRLKQVAAEAGASVDPKPDCRVNIQIVFTSAPQALLDNVRKNQPTFLGYHDSEAQADQLARIVRPIQAWYMSERVDQRGNVEIEGAKHTDFLEVQAYMPGRQPPWITIQLPNASAVSSTSTRLGDGMRSRFHQVMIVIDPGKLAELDMGTVADYIALVSLTELADPNACQGLPSIVNLLATSCTPVDALTDNDRGYLRGLYHMSPDQNASVQQDEIGYQMQQSLEGK